MRSNESFADGDHVITQGQLTELEGTRSWNIVKVIVWQIRTSQKIVGVPDEEDH